LIPTNARIPLATLLVILTLGLSAEGARDKPTLRTTCAPYCPRGTMQIALGGQHTCAVSYSGAVKCWGANAYGQLGDGSWTDRSTPVAVPALTQVKALALGFNHSCALHWDGTVKCWGANGKGQLGLGTTDVTKLPTVVPGLTGVTQITAGGSHTCALLNTGVLQCWGYNGKGALGDGTNIDRLVPTPVPGLNVTQVSAGGSEFGIDVTCAVLADQTARCWGANDKGQLGNGSTTDSANPMTVVGLSGVLEIAAGAQNACARSADMKVKCWGDDQYGAVGNGTVDPAQFFTTPSPIVMPLIAKIAAITVGSGQVGWGHGCALIAGGELKCWGWGIDGELGVSAGPTFEQTPLTVFVMIGGAAVAAGGQHTCGLIGSATTGSGMTLKCWGRNAKGALGTGGVPAKAFMAVPVPLTWP
jgi:alpha-tubulin suppressor-like RCC1 family protein